MVDFRSMPPLSHIPNEREVVNSIVGRQLPLRHGGYDIVAKNNQDKAVAVLDALNTADVTLFRCHDKDKHKRQSFNRLHINNAENAHRMIEAGEPMYYQVHEKKPCICFFDFDLCYGIDEFTDDELKKKARAITDATIECATGVIKSKIPKYKHLISVRALYDLSIRDYKVSDDNTRRKLSIHMYLPCLVFADPSVWKTFLSLMATSWKLKSRDPIPWDIQVSGKSQCFRCPYSMKFRDQPESVLRPHIAPLGSDTMMLDYDPAMDAIKERFLIPFSPKNTIKAVDIISTIAVAPPPQAPLFVPKKYQIDSMAEQYIRNIIPDIQAKRRRMPGATLQTIPSGNVIESIKLIPGKVRMWEVRMQGDTYCECKGRSHSSDTNKDKTSLTFDLQRYRYRNICYVCGAETNKNWRSLCGVIGSSGRPILSQLSDPTTPVQCIAQLYAGYIKHTVKSKGTKRSPTYTYYDEHTCTWIDTGYSLKFPSRFATWFSHLYVGHIKSTTDDPEIAEKIGNWKGSTENNRMTVILNASFEFVEDRKFGSSMNPDPFVVPFAASDGSGMIYDAKTNTTRRATPEDRLTALCPFDPTVATQEDIAAAQRFMAELACEWRAGDLNELTDYLITLGGYFISGCTFDRRFYMFHGNGRNGKSVFVKIMAQLLGTKVGGTPGYYCGLTNNFFGATANQATGAEQASPQAANAKDVTLSVITELPSSCLDQDKLKKWVGQDSIEARGLYESGDSFIPRTKILLLMNKRPKYPVEQAFWDRASIIHAATRYTDDPKQKHHLKADESKVQALQTKHINGFGHIFCRALHRIYKDGPVIPGKFLSNGDPVRGVRNQFKLPSKVVAITQAHRMQADYVSRFINETLEIVSGTANRVDKSELFAKYTAWSTEAGFKDSKLDLDEFNCRVSSLNKVTDDTADLEAKGDYTTVCKQWIGCAYKSAAVIFTKRSAPDSDVGIDIVPPQKKFKPNKTVIPTVGYHKLCSVCKEWHLCKEENKCGSCGSPLINFE